MEEETKLEETCMDESEAPEAVAPPAEPPKEEEPQEDLRHELDEANAKVEQLERERFLLLQGVPEEDLDYCVFRIGKMVSAEKDFRAAAKEFLKRHETGAGGPGFRTGASLSGRSPKTPPTANETMNRLLRASR